MPELMSQRQQKILEFLQEHLETYSYPPTVREIGRAVGLSSSSTVQNHLNALERKGLIQRDPTKSRTVAIVGRGERPVPHVIQVPLVGRVAAGTPVLAAENIEDRLSVGPEIAGSEDAFGLRVHGDSMIEAGINDGDIVLVRPQKTANNGEIVVARITNPSTGEGEVTVKRYYREQARIRLQPENHTMQPLYPEDVVLEGRVVAVIRLL